MSETLQLGLLGYPVRHSISPRLHALLLEQLAIQGTYELIEVAPESLDKTLSHLRQAGWRGFNVTLPHKVAVAERVDRLSDEAAVVGAVNTVLLDEGYSAGFNTDVFGFRRAVQSREVNLARRQAVVLGAGGAANAVVAALVQEGAEGIIICNRSIGKAKRLADTLRHKLGFRNLAAGEFSQASIESRLKDRGVLINATSVGMLPNEQQSPFDFTRCRVHDLVVVDLVYNPLQTRFLAGASLKGFRTVDGLLMLIYQGLEAMRLWLGRTQPLEVDVESVYVELKAHLEHE